MRPLELTVEGFRSYAGRATFDWRDRRLVGVVGPIGSGKSSLLDAISFALYGMTPTVGRDTKSLINQRAEGAQVEFVFEVEGQLWKAFRGPRRRGQSQHALYHVGEGGEHLETITGETPVRHRVEALLGLDFKAFCRSVLLAQNQFAEFLHAGATDRDEVLKGVFGFDTITEAHAVVGGMKAGALAELASFERERQQVAEARVRLREAKERAKAARTRLKDLERLRPKVAEMDEVSRQAEREAEAHAGRLDELDAIRARLPKDEDVDRASLAAERQVELLAAAASEVARARKAHAAAEKALAATEKKTGDRATLARARSLLATFEERARSAEEAGERLASATLEASSAAGSLEERAEKLSDAEAVERKATEVLAAATEALREREEEFEAARRGDMAMALRAELHAGQPCPVCEQPVAKVPKRGRAGLKEATSRRDHARRDERTAAAARDRLSREAASAREGLLAATDAAQKAEDRRARAQEDLERVGTSLEQARGALEQLLGRGEHRALLVDREARLEEAESALGEAADALRAADEAHERLRTSAEDERNALQSIAHRLIAASAQLGATADVRAEPAAIRDAAAEVRKLLEESRSQTDEALTAARRRLEEAARAFGQLSLDLGLFDGQSFQDGLVATTAESRSADTEVEVITATLKAAGDLEERVAAGEARLATLARLSEDLTPSRFLRYLLEEERVTLAALGSEHFERLTNGDYRFTDDGTFNVVDLLAAGAVRSSDSLSGGESFLASLALALALAEMVNRSAGRLDAFFLDEGFGTLDPEHLDRAMDGIERLVADSEGRIVVLVSHVPEMRERIEDLIVLTKDDATGDTIVVSGARP